MGRESSSTRRSFLHKLASRATRNTLSPEPVEAVRPLQQDERPTAGGRVGRDHRPPTPSLARDAPQRHRPLEELGLALPHRPLRADTPGADRAPAAADLRVRRHESGTWSSTCRRGSTARGVRIVRRRSTRCPPRTWRSPPTTPPMSATSSESTSTGRLMTQVSRFDPWKDPIGVIDAYRQRHQEIPEVQLALLGRWPPMIRSGWESSTGPSSTRGRTPTSRSSTTSTTSGAIEVNAFQSQSACSPAEVDPRGLRPDRRRGALEGTGHDRRRRRRHPAADRRREDGYLVSSPDEAAERWRPDPSGPGASAEGWVAPARSARASVS